MPAGTPARVSSSIAWSPVSYTHLDVYKRQRKESVARVWLKPGKGEITVNGRPVVQYFARPVLRMLLTQPFLVSDRYNQFDVICTVNGGGLSGQAGAVRHGISRALTNYEPDLRGICLLYTSRCV